MPVKLRLEACSPEHVPAYQSDLAAGFDLKARLEEPVTIYPMGTMFIPCGIKVAIPEGYELQVRSRSGLARKNKVFVLNAPGTVDADYRGEIGAILTNLGSERYVVRNLDRICQAVLKQVEKAEFELCVVDENETERGAGGFGSTGIRT
jgi:dUTP pyrophosphatase